MDTLEIVIDGLYSEIAVLQGDPGSEKLVSALRQRLRELQKQEGDLIREVTRSKVAPIAAGLDLLRKGTP